MASVYPHKCFIRQQVKPLQHYAHQQGWPVGKIDMALVAAAFNAYDLG